MRSSGTADQAFFPARALASLLTLALLPMLSGCYLLDGPAGRSDTPRVVVSEYTFAQSAAEREPLVAPESRAEWDYETALPFEAGLTLEGSTEEPADRADAERDHPFLSSWNDAYTITDDYEDGVSLRWLVGQREPDTDWYIIDIEVMPDMALEAP